MKKITLVGQTFVNQDCLFLAESNHKFVSHTNGSYTAIGDKPLTQSSLNRVNKLLRSNEVRATYLSSGTLCIDRRYSWE
jgi:hypothetical protein